MALEVRLKGGSNKNQKHIWKTVCRQAAQMKTISDVWTAWMEVSRSGSEWISSQLSTGGHYCDPEKAGAKSSKELWCILEANTHIKEVKSGVKTIFMGWQPPPNAGMTSSLLLLNTWKDLFGKLSHKLLTHPHTSLLHSSCFAHKVHSHQYGPSPWQSCCQQAGKVSL